MCFLCALPSFTHIQGRDPILAANLALEVHRQVGQAVAPHQWTGCVSAPVRGKLGSEPKEQALNNGFLIRKIYQNASQLHPGLIICSNLCGLDAQQDNAVANRCAQQDNAVTNRCALCLVSSQCFAAFAHGFSTYTSLLSRIQVSAFSSTVCDWSLCFLRLQCSLPKVPQSCFWSLQPLSSMFFAALADGMDFMGWLGPEGVDGEMHSRAQAKNHTS